MFKILQMMLCSINCMSPDWLAGALVATIVVVLSGSHLREGQLNKEQNALVNPHSGKGKFTFDLKKNVFKNTLCFSSFLILCV